MDCRYCQKRDAHPICPACKREQGQDRDAYFGDAQARRYEETGR